MFIARTIKFSKEAILEKSVAFIKDYGYHKLTVRDLVKYIGCSTQPIFKNFDNFDMYKKELKIYLRKDYSDYINKYINKTDYLYTMSCAYALYAKKEPNVFSSLFMTDLADSRTVAEVLNTDRNRETIYAIATQLCVNSIKLTDREIKDIIKNNIEINLGGINNEN